MLKVVLSLSIIGGFRFFGLFVVMPMLSIYVMKLEGGKIDSNIAGILIGLSVSSYAISQIIFQIPFGILGDRFQKRHLIAIGLAIFSIGSFVCAFANSVEMIILGRLVQGSGAIGSLVSANIVDLVKEEKRGYAMAFMGIMIFVSFILAMIIGPSIGVRFGVDRVFLLTAFLSLLSIVLLYLTIPKSPKLEYVKQKGSYKELLKNKNILILNISVLLQKFLMTFAFTIIPIMLIHHLNMLEKDIWKVFALSALGGFIALMPGMIISEKFGRPKLVLIIAIVLFFSAYFIMNLGDKTSQLNLFIVGVILFFCAFCLQEPILQNLASKYPKIYEKSLSLGIFTTFGFLGSFFGGIIGGALFDNSSFGSIILIICSLILCWGVLVFFLNDPINYENLYLNLDSNDARKLDGLKGILEHYINKSENVLVIKFDKKEISKNEILEKVKI